MQGLMQNRPLLISTLIEYAAAWHGDREIVSRDPEGSMHRTTYSALQPRAKRLASALHSLGVGFGVPVATLAWNSFRHLELYYGVTGSGRILHTVNPRLFHDQIQYIINHAEDRYVFFDPVLAPLAEQLAPHLPLVRGWIALCDAADMPVVKLKNLLCYEDILAGGQGIARMADLRRKSGRDFLLHIGNHRQSKGRSLQSPLDLASCFQHMYSGLVRLLCA